jgi:hypothetical protein
MAAAIYQLFEDEPAISARAADERLRAAARRTRVAAEVDRRGTLALEARVPLPAQQLGQLRQLGLLDEEVRARPSTLAGRAGRAADLGDDAGVVATLAHRLHLGDRASERGNDRHLSDHFRKILSNARRIAPVFFWAL